MRTSPAPTPTTNDEITDGEATSQGEEELLLLLSKEGVQNWVKTKLSSHLAPKYVFWIDEYPKTASGKIQKYKLRDIAQEMLS
ncbi:hypothetical protein NPX13_g7074 [Xylaria arbuscula]|uniref:AMP-binding enzyme C-terminal domain-containing protein n=1 Tax=Xylaria arbuscula TaxID=114810 RepID=A0A9W8NAP1_9PEZI|nr:hypothetical protein NPX13_g7074 [Xylaria arbuscula]